MIISGNFIAMSVGDDYEVFEGDTPTVVWFNINNISSFACYLDRYQLTLCNERDADYILKPEAANKLIEYMRKERDKETQEKVANLIEEMKNGNKRNGTAKSE